MTPPSTRPAWFAAAAAAGFAALALLADLGRWGGDEIFGVDSLTFHLPNVGRWIQSGTVWQLDQFLPWLAHANYPNNGDVVLLATILPWHNDFLVRAPIALCVAAHGVAVAALARELRAPAAACVLAGAAAISIPIVGLTSIPTAFPDALAWWTFATGALFLLRHARTDRRSDLVLAGVAFAIACGTKWYGFSSVFAAVALWLLIRLWAGRRRPAAWRAALRDGAIVGGLALLGVLPWLARNLALSENPFFPVKIAPFGITIFDAPPDRILEQSGPSIADYIGDVPGMKQLAFEFLEGLGPVAIVAGLALPVALVLARCCPRVLATGAVAVELLVLYVVTPSTALSLNGVPVLANANTRYAMPGLLLALGVVAWLAGRLGRLAAHALLSMLALAVVLGATSAYQVVGARELVLAAIVIAIGAAAARAATARLAVASQRPGPGRVAGARGARRRGRREAHRAAGQRRALPRRRSRARPRHGARSGRQAHRPGGAVVARQAVAGVAELRSADRQHGDVRRRDAAERVPRPLPRRRPLSSRAAPRPLRPARRRPRDRAGSADRRAALGAGCGLANRRTQRPLPRARTAYGLASSAWLTSASASAFCARGTERIDQRSKSASASSAAACSGFMSGCLTL